MADKNTVGSWSTTPGDNDNVGGVPLGENVMLPSQVNNAFREMMAQLKAFFKADVFRIWDGTDTTKKLAFDLSGITTATTRTLRVPNATGEILIAGAQPLTAAQQGQARANLGLDAFPRRNFVINGDCRIWQRGAATRPIGEPDANRSVLGPDRIFGRRNGSGTTQFGRSGTRPNEEFLYSVYLQSDGGASDVVFGTTIEAADAAALVGPVTISAYVAGDTGAGAIVVVRSMEFPDVIGSAPTAAQQFFNFPTGSSWKRIEATLDLSEAQVRNGIVVEIESRNGAMADGQLMRMTGLQVEKGSFATPFEHRPFGYELARCQRFFCKTYEYGTAPGTPDVAFGSMSAVAGSTEKTAAGVNWRYPVETRGRPTITPYSYATGAAGKITLNGADTDGEVYAGGTSGAVLRPTVNVTAGARTIIHATADAEITS